MTSLCDLFCNATSTTRTITFVPGVRRLASERDAIPDFYPDVDGPAIQAKVHELSPDASIQIDSIAYDIIPPRLTKKVPGPDMRGIVEEFAGYDYDDPQYKKDKLRAAQRQDIMTCLLGCPDLNESTPGAALEDKILHLFAKGSQTLLAGLSHEIQTLGYRSEGADFFPSIDSPSTPSSSDGPSVKKAAKKRPSKKR